jgi:hypothetical protein
MKLQKEISLHAMPEIMSILDPGRLWLHITTTGIACVGSSDAANCTIWRDQVGSTGEEGSFAHLTSDGSANAPRCDVQIYISKHKVFMLISSCRRSWSRELWKQIPGEFPSEAT